MYENKKILILGAAKSGIAVAKLLAGKNNNITISDNNEVGEKEELLKLGINVIEGDNQLDLITTEYDLIIKNPAIKFTSEIVTKINELGIHMENEMEVAYHFLPKNVTIIGVTGSNGKTTTTTMIYELLKRSNISVVLGGNIGFAMCDVIKNVKENDILLLEISDHQLLEFKDFKTNISVLTNICPTHLDYHGTYEHYMNTKKIIFNKHTSNDIAIINKKNEDSLKVTEDILSTKRYFNDENNYYNEEGIFIDNKLVLRLDEILLEGSHNYENIISALVCLKDYEIDINVIKDFYKTFSGVEHRLEFVKESNGVRFYNDSKATNPTATITALKTFKQPIHLILGGQERNQDFNELNEYMGYVKCIYAIGTVTDRIEDYAKDNNYQCIKCYNLEKAVEKIRENLQENDIVLLSTASASQDFYKKFEDRGNEFKKLVENI